MKAARPASPCGPNACSPRGSLFSPESAGNDIDLQITDRVPQSLPVQSGQGQANPDRPLTPETFTKRTRQRGPQTCKIDDNGDNQDRAGLQIPRSTRHRRFEDLSK